MAKDENDYDDEYMDEKENVVEENKKRSLEARRKIEERMEMKKLREMLDLEDDFSLYDY